MWSPVNATKHWARNPCSPSHASPCDLLGSLAALRMTAIAQDDRIGRLWRESLRTIRHPCMRFIPAGSKLPDN
jgi:hypothetical protein